VRNVASIRLNTRWDTFIRLPCVCRSVMSETQSQTASDESADDNERELLQLTDAEVHAFELGVKEIIRESTPTEIAGATEALSDCNPQQDHLEKVGKRGRTSGGFYSLKPHDLNDLFAAVAESPLIECVDVSVTRRNGHSREHATLVHTEYVDEYVEYTQEEDDQ